MRPGEKLFEELFTESEQRESGVHAKVFEAVQHSKDPLLLDQNLHLLQGAIMLPEGSRQREMLRCFKRLVPSYQPSMIGLGSYAIEETGILASGAEEVPLFN